MRTWVAFALALLAACSTGGGTKDRQAPGDPVAGARRTAPRLPNIVLFSIDTLRADHLGAYGYNRGTSPNIDGFGRDAMSFENAVSQAPNTAPSHMSLFTGLTPAVHGVDNIDGEGPAPRPLDPAIPTFPELLRESGYRTVGLNGGGNVDGSLGFARGFDLYSSDFISYNWMRATSSPRDLEVVRHWLHIGRDQARPVFLFLHHYVCHAPYLSAPEAYRTRFAQGRRVKGLPWGEPDSVRDPILDRMGRLPPGAAKSELVGRLFSSQLRSFWAGVDLSRPDHREHVVALYDAGVAYADELFGRVMGILREEGAYDDSIVVLLSDHGEEFFEHGGREHGRLFVEHLHVPLMIRFPARSGLAPRAIRDEVRVMDVMATVADYLGLAPPRPVQARSFMPLVRGRGGYAPAIASYGGPPSRPLRIEDGGFSYSDEPLAGVVERLFDRASDRYEQHDLSSSRPDVLRRMRDLAASQRAEDSRMQGALHAAPAPKAIDPGLLDQLRSLGYLE
jgi:arylsulfatase A-like enzyme